jgi:predicted nucleotidyltransferase
VLRLLAGPGLRDHRAAPPRRGSALLLPIVARIIDSGVAEKFGVTGSFLAGCFNARSDIDLVCYGPDGYAAAQELFADPG